MKCLSTHNGCVALEGDGLKKAIDLNQILGSRTIVMASPGRTETLDDWKRIAETLTRAAEYYLIEQEGSRFPSIETAEKCLTNFRKVRPKA